MKKFFIFLLFLVGFNYGCKKIHYGPADTITGETIMNHLCTDLSKIPDNWIDSVKKNLVVHYAHTSHGSQIIIGIESLAVLNPKYAVDVGYSHLPTTSGVLKIFDGQEDDDYITPDEYWETKSGMDKTRNVLTHNPSINVSMWCWCTQVNYYEEEEIQAYLDSIYRLATEFPDVQFVFFTGNAQAEDYEGYNRHLMNEKIRQFCKDHSLPCFDFGDIDSWYYNGSSWEQATYNYEGTNVPVEHPHFHGDEAAHTTYESCLQKGKAFWWLLARIAGWEGE